MQQTNDKLTNGKIQNRNNRIGERNNSIIRKVYKNEWWDEERRQAIKQQNKARMKCHQQKN